MKVIDIAKKMKMDQREVRRRLRAMPVSIRGKRKKGSRWDLEQKQVKAILKNLAA